MAKDPSFDVVSEFDQQELVNAVDQVKRELKTRFDLKDSGCEIELDGDKAININAPDDMKIRNVYDILCNKLTGRKISIKILDAQKVENALGGNVKQEYKLRKGISKELAKKVIGDIKDMKLKKVQASIQDDQIRVVGKNRDDLQAVIQALREKEYDTPLQFTNFR